MQDKKGLTKSLIDNSIQSDNKEQMNHKVHFHSDPQSNVQNNKDINNNSNSSFDDRVPRNDSNDNTKDSDDVESQDYRKRITRADLATLEFYRHDHWFDELCEVLFKIKERKTTVKLEIYYGFIHFISCLYVLAVVPQQLNNAGYNKEQTVVALSACCGMGSIIGGLFTNLPFVIAPVSVVSIFLSVYLQSNNMNNEAGSAAVLLSGCLLMFLFWRPLGEFIVKLIPLPIQVGTSLGVGLLTALAGAVEINMVQQGEYSLLQFGPITSEVVIAMIGLLVICISLYYHMRGAFVIALIGCSLVWWVSSSSWPSSIVNLPTTTKLNSSGFYDSNVPNLTVNLVFLYILYLSGLIPAFSDLAELKREDGTTPRSRWFYIIAGIMTIISGVMISAPILVSPESSAGIKAGAKTGLSTFICGILFSITVFFSPIFEAVPSAGTSPLLLAIGIILFQNVNRVDWKRIDDAAPAFVTLFFIPFTYSIVNGVALGYIVYIIINLFTGNLFQHAIKMYNFYFPKLKNFHPKDLDDINITSINEHDDASSRHSVTMEVYNHGDNINNEEKVSNRMNSNMSNRSGLSVQLHITEYHDKLSLMPNIDMSSP